MSETITVTQLNTRVKELLGSSPGVRDIWVSGEISNLKRYSSGHYYFTLKDQGSEIRAVLFSGARSRLDFEPADNSKVVAFGRVDMYVQRGSYQFIVETMRRSGVGDLYARYEMLKAKLDAEGLFSAQRKRPLPRYPRTIGVVTSQSGAVIHDIITTSRGRFPADIVLAPAHVQGEGSADSIVAGIDLLNRHGVDVIIVGRGGGSIEDLWAFNEEPVARAIAASRAPVVSAVGHETDFTIADFVADVRAPTPTGAAAIILRDSSEVSDQIDRDMARLNRAMTSVVDRMRSRFDILDAKLSPSRAADSLAMRRMHLDELSVRADSAQSDAVESMRRRFTDADRMLSLSKALDDIEQKRRMCDRLSDTISVSATRRLESCTSALASLGERPEHAISRIAESLSARLSSDSGRLDALNPMNVLGRGYGMISSGDGRVLTSLADVSAGDRITITMRDGRAGAEITDKEMNQ